jgi:hypothetical protein
MAAASISVYSIAIVPLSPSDPEHSLFCVVGDLVLNQIPVLVCKPYFTDNYELLENDGMIYQSQDEDDDVDIYTGAYAYEDLKDSSYRYDMPDSVLNRKIDVTTDIEFISGEMLATAVKIGECPIHKALSNCIMGIGIYRAVMQRTNRVPEEGIAAAEDWSAQTIAAIARSIPVYEEARDFVQMCITKGLKTQSAYDALADVFRVQHMARVIQHGFRCAIADPSFSMCKGRLQREFDAIHAEIDSE